MPPDNLKFKAVDHWSLEYRQAIYIRYKELREPLGLKFSRPQFEEESLQFHLVGEINDKIIACLSFIPFPGNRLRMRQVAVISHLQGLGIGKKLVNFAEDFAGKTGAQEIFLHARETVIPFYLKLGYQIQGEKFVEVNLNHYKMYKYINSPPDN
jgi:N-acetylglutamate synthase-like GNAT family acetyltransferase